MGTTEALLNDAQAASDSYTLRAFGKLVAHTDSSTSPFTFVGRQGYYSDPEIDLYFVRRRYYDFAAGRWVSEDPAGYGPDANLYRYAGNDPVNATDPSGLVRLYGWNPDETWGKLDDDDKARWGMLCRQGWRLRVTQDGQTRPNFATHDDIKVDVFDSDWKGWLDAGRDVDWTHNKYGIDYPNKQVWIDAYINNHAADFVHTVLHAIVNDERLPPENRRSFWEAVIPDWLRQAAEALVEGVKRSLTFTFNVALKAAGLDPEKFWDAVKQVLSDAGQFIRKLVADGQKIFETFFSGAKAGLEEFCGAPEITSVADLTCPDFGKRLVAGLQGWLGPVFSDIGKLVEAVSSGDLSKAGGVLIDLIGLGWDGILTVLGKVGQQIGVNLLPVVTIVQALAQGLEAATKGEGPGGWVLDIIMNPATYLGELADKLEDIDPGQLAGDLWDKVKAEWTDLIPPVAAKALAKLASMFDPTGVGAVLAWIKTLYDMVQFFVGKAKEFLDIFATLKEGFRLVVEGGAEVVSQIRTKVSDFLVKTLPITIGALATFFKLGDIPDKLKEGLAKVRDKAQAVLVKLLKALAKPVQSLLAGLLEGGQGRQVLTKPVALKKDPQARAWLEAGTGAGVKVMAMVGGAGREVTGGRLVSKLKMLGDSVRRLGEKAAQGTASGDDAKNLARNKAEAEKLIQDVEPTCAVGGTCFAAGTVVQAAHGPTAIEALTAGGRVITFAGDERTSGQRASASTIDAKTWKRIRLTLGRESGDTVDVVLLRGADWLAAHHAREGGTVFLDMPEMGAKGQAMVMAIGPCPTIPAGEGRLVTGTFRHRRGIVYDLKVQGEPAPVAVTGTHPFWSVDRQEWVPVKELRVGQRLQGLDSTPTVESLTLRAGPEPVFNLEVEGEHCYLVGQQGLLVHNASAPSFRILRPDQSPGAANLTPGCVVKDQTTITQVIASALTAQGTNTSPITGFYAFLRGGRRRGGAGFQGVTKNPLTRLAVVIANIGQSQGSVAAAIDLSALDQANVFDLEDTNVWQQLITRWSQNQAFFTQLRDEGVVGVMGSIPASAVRAIVLLPTSATDRDAALTALLS